MGACDVRAAVAHAIPGGIFSRPELSDVDVQCGRPADWRVTVRGLDHGNHREDARAIEVEMCDHHLQAFQQIDARLHALGWSHAVHGSPAPLGTASVPS